MLWTSPAHAIFFFKKLRMCRADLMSCEAELEACEAEGGQIFPGDGYTDPSFGTIGHGPALSYTDNGDGTATDNNTKFIWEVKLAANDVSGNCADPTQANRSVHCVNNTYTWSASGTAADGTLFTVFLAELNNSAFAGFSDWCIQNVKRLQSIVDYELVNPSIDPTFPGATLQSSNYWSSTTRADNTVDAWSVSFFSGFVVLDFKGNSLFARAVRPCS